MEKIDSSFTDNIEIKKKEVNSEILKLRSQYYKIIEEENNEKEKYEEAKGPPDVSFLNDEEWSGF